VRLGLPLPRRPLWRVIRPECSLRGSEIRAFAGRVCVSPMSTTPTIKEKGDVVEGYRVMAEIGRGAASIVYLVQDPKTKQVWALKHLEKNGPKDQRFLDQAEIEYKIAQKLDHKSIRQIPRMIKKGSLLSSKELFLVMEFVDGAALDTYRPKTFVEAVDMFTQTAHALEQMHERGFVHADMKPHNVMACPDISGAKLAKIIDLGQSCKIGTVKPRIQGTPDYIAPEQVRREQIVPKTDVYNLGATMYWVLTRQHIPTAFAKGDNSLSGSLDAVVLEKPTPANEINKNIDQRLSDLLMLCVEPSQARRPTMSDVADKLELILGVLRTRAESEASKAGLTLDDGQ